MPLTRKQQFSIAVRECIHQLCPTNNPEQYFTEWSMNDLYPLASSSVHHYTLTFPHQLQRNIDGVTSTVEQQLPTPDVLKEQFNAYFTPYYQFCTWTGERTAYVEMTEIEDDGVEMIGTAKVVYKPRYYPYPIQKTPIEQLRDECRRLERACEINNNIIRVQKKTQLKLRQKMRRYQDRMQQIVRDGYEIVEKYTKIQEKCPVCIGEITTKENLMVPLCGHFICSDCMPNCDKCPMCRDVYIRAPSSYVANLLGGDNEI